MNENEKPTREDLCKAIEAHLTYGSNCLSNDGMQCPFIHENDCLRALLRDALRLLGEEKAEL